MGNVESTASDDHGDDERGRRSSRSGAKPGSAKKSSSSSSSPEDVATRAQKVVGENLRELSQGLQKSLKKLEETDHPAAALIDSVCGPYLDSRHSTNTTTDRKFSQESPSFYSEDVSEEDSRTVSEDESNSLSREYRRKGLRKSESDSANHSNKENRKSSSKDKGSKEDETMESSSYMSHSDIESHHDNIHSAKSGSPNKGGSRTKRGTTMTDESSFGDATEDDFSRGTSVANSNPRGVVTQVEEVPSLHSKPLASAFAKRCYFTKAGIGKTTQHYEGLTLTGNVVLMLAAAMKLKGCPTICDEDLRRVEQIYPNQFSRLPDELLLSSGWRRISKYCHFSSKPIPDGVPFFHSKQRIHASGGYYFLLAAAVGMVRPMDVEPLNRDTLVLLETDFPAACDAAPRQLVQDPDQWTLVDKFCFFSGGPINTEEDVYYQADFDGNPIFMLAFLSPSLTPTELYKLNLQSSDSGGSPGEPGLKTVREVEEVESVYDLTDRDFEDLKLYHLGPCRALPPYLLQPAAWTKVLPPHFLAARQTALVRAQDYEIMNGTLPVPSPANFVATVNPSPPPQAASPTVLTGSMQIPQPVTTPQPQYGSVEPESNPAYIPVGQPSPGQYHTLHPPGNPSHAGSYAQGDPSHQIVDPSAPAMYHHPMEQGVAAPYYPSGQPHRVSPYGQMDPNIAPAPMYGPGYGPPPAQQDMYGTHHMLPPDNMNQRLKQAEVYGAPPQQPVQHVAPVMQRTHVASPIMQHTHDPYRQQMHPSAPTTPLAEPSYVQEVHHRDMSYGPNVHPHASALQYGKPFPYPSEAAPSPPSPPDDSPREEEDDQQNNQQDYHQAQTNTSYQPDEMIYTTDSASLPMDEAVGNDTDSQQHATQEVSNDSNPEDEPPSLRKGALGDESNVHSRTVRDLVPHEPKHPPPEDSYYHDIEDPDDNYYDGDDLDDSYYQKENLESPKRPQTFAKSAVYEEEPTSDPEPPSPDDASSANYVVLQRRHSTEDVEDTSVDQREGNSVPPPITSRSPHNSEMSQPYSNSQNSPSFSSAFRGAQELLRRNRLKRYEMAIKRKQQEATGGETALSRKDNVKDDRENSRPDDEESVGDPDDQEETTDLASPRTDGESTTGSVSDATSLVSGSSVWTDGTNTPDRSSRRALILQMARARMKSNKSGGSAAETGLHGGSEVGSSSRTNSYFPKVREAEEEKKLDSQYDVSAAEIDLTEDLD